MCYDQKPPSPRSPITVAAELVTRTCERDNSICCEAAKLLRDMHAESEAMRECLRDIVSFTAIYGETAGNHAHDALEKANQIRRGFYS